MLDFKCCKNYNEAVEKEYCTFSSICKDKCYFTLKSDSGVTTSELEEKIKKLESDVKALNQELDCYTDSSNEDNKHIECLYDCIVEIIQKQKGVKTPEGLSKKYNDILVKLEDYSGNAREFIYKQII